MLYFQRIKVRSYLQLIIAPLMLGMLLFLSNCNPAERYQYHYPISQETKDYCYFKQGSWWVYIDSNKMVYDTVKCIESTIGKEYDASVMDFPAETFYCRFSSSRSKDFFNIHGPSPIFDTLDFQAVVRLMSPPNYEFYVGFFESSDMDSIFYNSKVVVKNKEIRGGLNFINSVTFTTYRANLPNELPYSISWAPHVGIVYKAMPDGANWELVDYKVIQ